MSADISTLCASLALDLGDAGGETWTEEELERAVEKALGEYNLWLPLRREAVLTLEEEGRQVDLSSLEGLLGVERVWFPYEDDAWPPQWCPFECVGPALTLLTPALPQAGQRLRLVYWAAHRIAGLAGAEDTTLPAEDLELVLLGAAGCAALERSRSAVGSINVSGYTPVHWADWANDRLEGFRRRLKELAALRGMGFAGPASFSPGG
jgi:hypothetical protein